MEPTRWLPFLSNASKILSESLDYKETLERIAELMVPALTDWCDVYMLLDERDEVFTRVTVKHRDPELMAELMRDGPRFRTVSRQIGHLSQTGAGKPILVDPITDEILQRSASSPEDLVVLRKLKLRSTLIVPLVARQTLLGTLILSMSDSGRCFGDEERAVAEELATRAALAVDNARLYRARVEGERQLRSIIDNSPAIIYLADGDGRILAANREYARRTGRPVSELVGRTIHDLMAGEGAARIAAMEQRVLEEARAIQYESTHAEPNGPRDWFVLKFPVTDEAGRVVGLGSISTDVTERKRAELALEHSQDRFEKIFRASPLAISVNALADGRFIEVNPACERLSGYQRSEMLGRTGTELGLWPRPDERARAVEALRVAGSLSGLEMQTRDRKGVLHDVLVSLERIDFGGESCTLALMQDVTESKRLRERLEHAQRMEALGRLAGGVAHDFNNILTAIQGYTSLLLDETHADAAAHERAAHVQRAAERAAALTRQLLVFGRHQVRETSVVEVNAIVNGVLGMLHRLIGEDVRLEIVPAADAACVAIDPGQLEQVIVNLALNARDAMPSGGRLRIETARARLDGDVAAVRLRVEDEGVGMDEATRARIFEPFFTTKPIGQGTGLGLATVYGIVEQVGGRIVVTSEPGHGARFDVLLPEATPIRAALVGSERGKAPLSPAMRGDTLLVVEDDASVCEFVCLVLREANYDILSANDGDAALRIAREHDWRVDLLVTDIVMPNRNGRSLANELRGRVPALRVMYMSGYPGDTIERYDQIPVGDAFLQKPFSREALLRMVARALGRP